ncbi:divisome protein SepX/GlpR [Nonomuraea longicatena]|uniref:Transmembrane protein n=1 Tax=Nonomuraea longicatena TaxID=83682 RepID=A0ABP4AT21_9ACTN
MSSVLLYLAIVVMWLCVLVPMWLRRDKTNLAELAELEEEYYTGEHQLPDLEQVSGAPPTDHTDSDETLEETPVIDPRQFRARRRAIIVARRRRLLFFTALLVIASLVTAAVKIMPWWGVAPSVVVMMTYLAFLRIAVQVDRERQRRVAEIRAERARRLRERRRREAEQAEAEIIEFTSRQADALFDQYAEPPRRAVGD